MILSDAVSIAVCLSGAADSTECRGAQVHKRTHKFLSNISESFSKSQNESIGHSTRRPSSSIYEVLLFQRPEALHTCVYAHTQMWAYSSHIT